MGNFGPPCSHALPARRCASVLIVPARECGRPRNACCPQRRESTRGAERARDRGSPTHIIFACRHWTCMQSTGTSAWGRCWGSTMGLPISLSQFLIRQACALKRLHGRGIGDRLLTIAPGTISETKHWLSERFAEVARHCIQNGFGVALMGSGREVPICNEVATAAPGVANFKQQVLPELAALIRRSTICLTNNSGPMHLAVALARPVVSVFGPTDALWIGPYQRPGAVLRQEPCSPCYLRVLSRCPHGHASVHAVTSPEVIRRIETVLANSGRKNLWHLWSSRVEVRADDPIWALVRP